RRRPAGRRGTRRPRRPRAGTGEVAERLADRLGDRSAGAYLDTSTNELVVTVTDSAAARTVRAAGAQARTVERSGADLRDVMAELKRDATVPGTAWAIDPASNQVVLSMDGTVTGADLKKVKSEAAQHGAAVRTERVAGEFRMFTQGGQAIYAGGGRCSLGFTSAAEARTTS
ncbi:alpha-lytic protease prodomain-containing protein, partial [Actinomadura sp. CNU-125]|uniref:alpha-lytic protease prodomain-containing protein n=1 Tax=Actinomadura sp. CNU-125 TaxID=1904961 RepID=UPI0021CC69A3